MGKLRLKQFKQTRAQLAHLVAEAFTSKYKRTKVFDENTYNLLGGYGSQDTANAVAEFVRETFHCYARVVPTDGRGWAEYQLWIRRK